MAIDGVYEYHTFISYHHDDSDAAESLTHGLQKMSLRPWLDRDDGTYDKVPRTNFDVRGKQIHGDDKDISSKLGLAIQSSILVTVISSPRTLKSTWVRIEIQMARAYEKPLFFWHVIEPETAETISVRRGGGTPEKGRIGAFFVRAVSPYYRKEFMASSDSITFMEELRSQTNLNVLAHLITPLSEVDKIVNEVKTMIELSELVIHYGKSLSGDSMLELWPEYIRLCNEASELEEAIRNKFGKSIEVNRMPLTQMFRLKRPFVLQRIQHLRLLLKDQSFRSQEFAKLPD